MAQASESSYYSSDYSDDYYSQDHYNIVPQEHFKADELPDPDKDKTAIFLGEFSAPVKVCTTIFLVASHSTVSVTCRPLMQFCIARLLHRCCRLLTATPSLACSPD